MTGSMVWLMMISPKSGDAMQRRMFYIMPVVFMGFCYNFASALSLYWTVSNVFSIVQMYATRNRLTVEPEPAAKKESVGRVASRGVARPVGGPKRRKG
jgi:YidC/Oxa1 family membrane protein insertase